MRYLLFLLAFVQCQPALAAQDALPEPVRSALKRAGIPLADVGVVVHEVGAEKPMLAWNADQGMNPASTMKLLTTFAALEILGPAYQWKTEVYLDGPLEDGVLHGDLVFRGYGDPKLTLEQFWSWLRELRQRGLRDIRGDVVLDRSFFGEIAHDPAEFDNEPNRAYNVGPSALLLNFNALHLRVVPGEGSADAMLNPELAGYAIRNRIRVERSRPCRGGDTYTARLEERHIVLEGSIPLDCGEVDDYISLLPHDEYFFAVFRSLWQELGGSLGGSLREGHVPADRAAYSVRWSQPLSELIRDINKYSNNTMARQLFLALGAGEDAPAGIGRSIDAMRQWLESQQLRFPELVLENGAGLSRVERISPLHLATILQRAARSPYSAELKASMPILGMDGTMRKRLRDDGVAGYGHIKTGMLEGVKSIAGYVHGADGRQWIVTCIINHPNAGRGQPAQDALIKWVLGTEVSQSVGRADRPGPGHS